MAGKNEGAMGLSPDQIRLTRQQLNLSQREMAKALGVSAAYIGFLETGARKPSTTFARRLEGLARGRGKQESVSNVEMARLGVAATGDFELLPPASRGWRAEFPFTVIVGPLGSGRTSFAARWLADLQSIGDAKAVWVPMSIVGGNLGLMHEALVGQLPTQMKRSFPQDLGPEAALADILNRIEGSQRESVVIGFDDWDPRGGEVHTLIGQLGLATRKARIVAVTEYVPGAVPGAAVVPIPEPAEKDWMRWAWTAQVPDDLAGEVVARVGTNLLAATYVRHSVAHSSALSTRTAAELWRRFVLEVAPAHGRPDWPELLRFCRELLGGRTWGIISRIVQAGGPVPLTAVEQDVSPDVAKFLLAARFVEPAGPPAPGHVIAHQVLVEQMGSLAHADASAAGADEAALVELERRVVSSSAKEARSYELQELGRLRSEQLDVHPTLRLALARRLADRGRDDDLSQAHSHLDRLLSQHLNDGLRWAVLLRAMDLAIHLHDYNRSDELASQLDSLYLSSGGAFDRSPLLVMRARAAWEQSRFREALDLLAESSPQSPADIARVANWKCRSLAALGNMAEALREAEMGAKVAEDAGLKGAEAFSLALAGQIHILRGTHGRARRALERAVVLADQALEMRAKPQALMTLAELDSIRGEATSARGRIQEMQAALGTRAPRIWDAAYATLCQARVARRSLDLDLVSSLAHMCTFEAGVVSSRAPHHPVVAALHAEAAASWAAAGYLHQASTALARVEASSSDWLTRFEVDQARLAIEDLGADQYLSRARDLSAAAADAGCPYLAVTAAHALALRARGRWSTVTAQIERWVVEVANARGWKHLASAGAAVVAVPESIPARERGVLIVNSDGTKTLIAPRRGQARARREPRSPLPDPFEE